MSQIENLRKLFLDQLKDAYDFEHQLVEALTEMEGKATAPQLKSAFAEHRKQTERQAQKLERVFKGFGEKPERKTCKAMKGLVAEGREIVKASGDDAALDAGLIAAAQKVEHYEMATYGTLRTFAKQLDREQEARLLQEILDEESQANEKLTMLATGGINQNAEEGQAKQSGLDGMLGALGLGGKAGGSRSRSSASSSGSRSASARGSKSSSRASGGTGKSGRSAAARSTNGASRTAKSNGTSKASSSRKAATSNRSSKSRHGASTGSSKGGSQPTRTKEELMEKARDLGIEGRSQMNKAQLERAVQKQRN